MKERKKMKMETKSANQMKDTENQEKVIPVRPVTVRLEDLKKNLNQVVAESELPPFLLVMVLREILIPMDNIAKKEYEQDREAWEKALKEGEKDG